MNDLSGIIIMSLFFYFIVSSSENSAFLNFRIENLFLVPASPPVPLQRERGVCRYNFSQEPSPKIIQDDGCLFE